ncbi:hypothetical protein Misp01_36700 [Microtetraspora sp. NBRC 13810]|uniref:recombination regulator RecX n=1 Tax=Microtetraspora sp. NBRC 13810 TaxID=3030990 RepID=UPI0024A57950|nr:recombination regulator RecX [Microtetraspora sp. NBRC 13810]GLW08540.1 hypothetical protein Misp01_36700 [Microtetraspora sp. NBRC 13810]
MAVSDPRGPSDETGPRDWGAWPDIPPGPTAPITRDAPADLADSDDPEGSAPAWPQGPLGWDEPGWDEPRPDAWGGPGRGGPGRGGLGWGGPGEGAAGPEPERQRKGRRTARGRGSAPEGTPGRGTSRAWDAFLGRDEAAEPRVGEPGAGEFGADEYAGGGAQAGRAKAGDAGGLWRGGDAGARDGARETGRSRRGRGAKARGVEDRGAKVQGVEDWGVEERGAEGDGWGGGRSRRRGGAGADRPEDGDPQAVARAICLRLLTMAPRTRAQLAEALRKREVPDDAAEAVLARFSDVGLIDDAAFADAWVSSRHAGRGLARRALAAELRHRGVDDDTVRDAVDRLDPDQEVETARRLVARKMASTRGLDPAPRTRRLVGMLARKGYSAGLAFRVVREALESEGAEVAEDEFFE